MKIAKASSFGAISTLLLLAVIGLVGLVWVVPAISQGLVIEYSEYSNDLLTIQLLLSSPVVLAIMILAEIIYLLVLLRTTRILTDSASNWVRLLAFTALALAASVFMLLGWLISKNTLPPAVGIVLLSGVLLALAVSLVTFSLLGLLQRATTTNQELEGVI